MEILQTLETVIIKISNFITVLHPRQHHPSGLPVAMSGKKAKVDHQRHAGGNRRVAFVTGWVPWFTTADNATSGPFQALSDE